jgi:hypothetical protein
VEVGNWSFGVAQRERLYRSVVGSQECSDDGYLTDCLVVAWSCGKLENSSQQAGVFIGRKKAGGEAASMAALRVGQLPIDSGGAIQPGSTLITSHIRTRFCMDDKSNAYISRGPV